MLPTPLTSDERAHDRAARYELAASQAATTKSSPTCYKKARSSAVSLSGNNEAEANATGKRVEECNLRRRSEEQSLVLLRGNIIAAYSTLICDSLAPRKAQASSRHPVCASMTSGAITTDSRESFGVALKNHAATSVIELSVADGSQVRRRGPLNRSLPCYRSVHLCVVIAPHTPASTVLRICFRIPSGGPWSVSQE